MSTPRRSRARRGPLRAVSGRQQAPRPPAVGATAAAVVAMALGAVLLGLAARLVGPAARLVGPAAAQAEAAAGEPYPFELFLKARGQVRATIAPGGNEVAYLEGVTGTDQVWKVNVAGGWPEQLTFFDERVSSLSWSHADPDLLVIGSDTGGNERHQLYLLRADGSKLVRITHDDEAIHSFGAWSPDGRWIAYRSNGRRRSDFDVHLLNTETLESRLVYESTGLTSAATFSGDGSVLIILRTVAPEEREIIVLELDSGASRVLTAGRPPARYHYTYWTADGRSLLVLTDRGRDLMSLARIDVEDGELTYLRDDPWPAERLEVSRDGRRLALTLNVDGYSELRLVDLVADRPLATPDLPRGVIAGLDFTPDGRRLAIVLGTPRSPWEVWVHDLETGELSRSTHAAMAGIPREALAEPRLVRYPTFDGREIPALLYVPPGAAGPRPCLVYAHGGPHSQSRPRFSSLTQYFVSRGFVVFAPNVRGSTGYGRTFMNLDNVEKREDSVADLKHGVDWLIAERLVDRERVAIYGGSYGGYMVLASLTLYPDMWAAGVSSVGISNFVTFLEHTGAYRRSHREREYGSLEHDRELLQRLSPLGRVERIRAPLLVIHGENDPRVPIYEAEQIVEALEERGQPVEFIRQADEGHGTSRLHNRVDKFTRVARFIDKHLGLVDAGRRAEDVDRSPAP